MTEDKMKSPSNCMTVADLVRRLSVAPQDALVHVDLADDDGNVWKGDVDGFFMDDDEGWLQAGFVHHQTPEETLELAGWADEEEEHEEEGEEDQE